MVRIDDDMTREEAVAEAWQLRQALVRRLYLNALERAKLERALDTLDDAFEGERIPNLED